VLGGIIAGGLTASIWGAILFDSRKMLFASHPGSAVPGVFVGPHTYGADRAVDF